MKNRSRLFILLSVVIMLFSATSVFANDIPNPGRDYYYDETGTLSESTKNEIQSINQKLEAATGSQIIVAVVNDIEGYGSIDEYATKFFEKWKIGDKDKNNGILFVTSMAERKMKFEIGYGLEGAIPDGKAGRILDEFVVPYYKKGDFNQGILNGFRSLVEEVQKEYNVESLDNIAPVGDVGSETSKEEIIVYIILTIIGIIYLIRFFKRGGGTGGGSGGYRGRSYRGTPFGGYTGSRGGSSYGGFGGSSGGFGGFSGGGGSSGGGGASRGW